MAHGWKRWAEAALARSGLPAWKERRGPPSVAILAYHNIVPRGEDVAGDVSLHVDQDVFARQLDWLARSRRVVSLAEASREAPTARAEDSVHRSPGDGRPAVVITFDDAYLGAMSAGMEELAKRSLPSTVFVAPGLLGAPGFWWDQLAPGGGRPLDAALRAHLLDDLRGEAGPIAAWAAGEGVRVASLPAHARPAAEDVVVSRGLPAGVTFGAHTWAHPNLARLTRDERHSELRRSREWLKSRTDRYVDWLAYPYGSADSGTEAAASEHFDGALLVAGGRARLPLGSGGSRWRVPRINVPRGLSLDGLALRLSGMIG